MADTADVISGVVDKISGGLAQISHAISESAPKAWELVVKGNFTEALVWCLLGGMLVVVMICTLIVAKYCLDKGWAAATMKTESYYASKGENWIASGVIALIVSALLLFASTMIFASNLAMVLQPEAMTAKAMMYRVIGR